MAPNIDVDFRFSCREEIASPVLATMRAEGDPSKMTKVHLMLTLTDADNTSVYRILTSKWLALPRGDAK